MLNTVYQLTSPKIIEEDMVSIDLNDKVIVRPTHLSICRADQRYYQGKRAAEILKKKLPMALIHESIGQIVRDNTGTFNENDRVVMIPNTPTEEDDIILENYLRSSFFRSSGYDGFLQELIQIEPDRLVKLPENIDLDILAFTELISVAIHAVGRFKSFSHERRNVIGVWGDGNLSYIVSLILSNEFPESDIYVFGKHREKLNMFSFVDGTYLIDEIPEDVLVDHAFESTGGPGCEPAINQIIDYIQPQGTISLLGVSENNVAINTRMVLEKGLLVYGSSRSGRDDFINTLKFLENNESAVDYLKNLIGFKITVENINDIHEAFSKDINLSFGKTIMHWNK